MAEDLSGAQRLSIKINKSIEGQQPSWKNWLSRKTSEYLFGKEFPYVNDTIKEAVEVLAVPDEQRRYLEAYHMLDTVDSDTKRELFPAFSRSARKLWESLPNDDDLINVSDRMDGLIVASQRTLVLVSNPEYYRIDKYKEEVETIASGLVNREAEFFANFRRSVQGEKPKEDYYQEPVNTLSFDEICEMMKLTSSEKEYLKRNNEVDVYVDGPKERQKLENAIVAVQEELKAERPTSPEVEDRINGLSIAYDRMSQLGGNQMLSKMPNFRAELAKVAENLVDKETRFFTGFRKSLEE